MKKKYVLSFLPILIVLILPMVIAANYGTGNYGAGNYGSGQSPSSPSVRGGGGSLPRVSSNFTDYSLSDTQFIREYLFRWVGSTITFKSLPARMGEHSITLLSYDTASKKATFKIESTPKEVALKTGDFSKLDLNNDGYYDFRMEIKSITAKGVFVAFELLDNTQRVENTSQKIKEMPLFNYTQSNITKQFNITSEKKQESSIRNYSSPVIKRNLTNITSSKATSYHKLNNISIFGLIVAGIIILIVIITYILKRKKSKKINF